jgi:hypothetical protein
MYYPPPYGAPPWQIYCPQPTGSPNPPPQQNFTSWKDVQNYAKKEAKREAKLRAKWEEESKKKKTDASNKTPTRASIPLLEGLFLAVLLSPLIGLPTLKFYQMLFSMWGAALGAK